MLWEFLDQYFIRPIYSGEGYNVYNTAVYALLFIIGAYGVDKLLKKWKVNIDSRLFDALLPFILFAGLLRSIQDYLPDKHWYLITPGIYLLMAALVITVLVITKRDLTKTKLVGTVTAAAAGITVFALAITTGFNIQWLAAMLGLAALLLLAAWKVFPGLLASRQNKAVFFAQVLDGSASAIAVSFLGYGEQHVVSSLVMQGNPFIFLGLKVALVLVALHLIDRQKSEYDWLLKIAICTLGLAPGTRDAARVFMGV